MKQTELYPASDGKSYPVGTILPEGVFPLSPTPLMKKNRERFLSSTDIKRIASELRKGRECTLLPGTTIKDVSALLDEFGIKHNRPTKIKARKKKV